LITLIEGDGKVVAARYGIVFDGKYWCYQAGFDPDYAKLCVGRLVLGWTAQGLMARGTSKRWTICPVTSATSRSGPPTHAAWCTWRPSTG